MSEGPSGRWGDIYSNPARDGRVPIGLEGIGLATVDGSGNMLSSWNFAAAKYPGPRAKGWRGVLCPGYLLSRFALGRHDIWVLSGRGASCNMQFASL